MNRREFALRAGLAAVVVVKTTPRVMANHMTRTGRRIRWTAAGGSRLFSTVACDGKSIVPGQNGKLLVGECRLWNEAPGITAELTPERPSAVHGPLRINLGHELRNGGGEPGEDTLEATLTVRNVSDRPQQIEVAFVTTASPSPRVTDQHLYLPLNAAGLSGDKRFTELGIKEFLKDCNQVIDSPEFQCHYLEPQASYPDEILTKALLLSPVIDTQQPSKPWHVALFTPSDQPVRFRSTIGVHQQRLWRVGRVVTVSAGGAIQQRCWLMVHRGDAATAWMAFHRFGHHEAHPSIDWVRDFKVHYYDFLSSAAGKNGPQGGGYDVAVPWFRAFHVGLATQHGYYPCMGDHIHPDRKSWLAMQGDKQGPVKMSFETIRARIKATRKAGAKAGIYMHLSAMDDSSQEFYGGLASGRRIGPTGEPLRFGWKGPDVKGGLWWMSVASPKWWAHLLQQAGWILDILKPDAICVDETFTGIGYDQAGQRRSPISPHAILFFKELHSLVRSFGQEKALFTSDCSMSGFSLWADGEVGDHAYPNLLGNPLYRQEPLRYLAVLGDKPWRPCAWHFRHMWKHQMALARQVGSGVGVSNGWIEYSGLHGLPEEERQRLIRDIETLL
ncbi:MAG: hypothetical protein ACYS6W_09400 [Planctomycetota bacterium]|jgi:hypothetical protein